MFLCASRYVATRKPKLAAGKSSKYSNSSPNSFCHYSPTENGMTLQHEEQFNEFSKTLSAVAGKLWNGITHVPQVASKALHWSPSIATWPCCILQSVNSAGFGLFGGLRLNDLVPLLMKNGVWQGMLYSKVEWLWDCKELHKPKTSIVSIIPFMKLFLKAASTTSERR